MSVVFAEELLRHAEDVVTAPAATEAALARAVSTAYYALFHLLVSEATSAILPSSPPAIANAVSRGFQHTVMKELCVSVAKGRLESFPPAIRQVFTDPIEPELAEIAQLFVDLQTTRHQADYAPYQPLAGARFTELVQQAMDAFSSWRIVRGTDNANAFCVALLLHKTWRAD